MGDDTITGGGGHDALTGGGGADTFVFGAGSSPVAGGATGVAVISDWSSSDHLDITVAGAFHTDATGTSFADAQTKANALLVANGTEHVAVVQVGADVIVFVDNGADHVADDAIILTGRALSDISAGNFI